MEAFEIQESDRFKNELEVSILWLYSHNLELSQEFADQKYFELQHEVNTLKNHLKRNPRMGQADEVSGIRRFPLHGGRYLATWLVIEAQKTAILLESLTRNIQKNCGSSNSMKNSIGAYAPPNHGRSLV